MRDAILLWRNTRMVVLVALTAATYAAILIPFKPIPIIPGITETRPAADNTGEALFVFTNIKISLANGTFCKC